MITRFFCWKPKNTVENSLVFKYNLCFLVTYKVGQCCALSDGALAGSQSEQAPIVRNIVHLSSLAGLCPIQRLDFDRTKYNWPVTQTWTSKPLPTPCPWNYIIQHVRVVDWTCLDRKVTSSICFSVIKSRSKWSSCSINMNFTLDSMQDRNYGSMENDRAKHMRLIHKKSF